MSNHLVQAEEITISFGPVLVLHNASFHIDPGDKIALVGPNGSGKSTLLELISGRLEPESGRLETRPGLRTGYMTQNLEFPGERTVAELLAESPPHLVRIENEMASIEARMATAEFYDDPGHQEVLAQYGDLQREHAELSARTRFEGLPPAAKQLGFTEADLGRPARDLSGGQKTRLLLARALVNRGNMDLLLLDEPTNHLDLETVEWVEELLANYEGGIVVVSHDRYLLDAVADRVIEIEGRRTPDYDGNYSDYREQKSAIRAAMEARRRKDRKEFERQWKAIQEVRKRGKHKQAKSREKRLERQKRTRAPYTPRRRPLNIRFPAVEKMSNDVAFLRGVSKRYDGRTVLGDVDLEVRKGDRIGVVGRNGAGKTTLVRMITGEVTPDAGTIDVMPGVKAGYFDQEHAHLDPDRSLVDELLAVRPKMPEAEYRGLLGRFGFSGDEVFSPIGGLSGGERARVALAKFIIDETNVLVLDEPTNHLDMDSQESIADAVANYPGTIIVVSHDRAFLDAVTNRTAWVHDGTVDTAPGSVSDALPKLR